MTFGGVEHSRTAPPILPCVCRPPSLECFAETAVAYVLLVGETLTRLEGSFPLASPPRYPAVGFPRLVPFCLWYLRLGFCRHPELQTPPAGSCFSPQLSTLSTSLPPVSLSTDGSLVSSTQTNPLQMPCQKSLQGHALPPTHSQFKRQSLPAETAGRSVKWLTHSDNHNDGRVGE